jgi:hypothetical protein
MWTGISGGYLNESGVINTRRLQMVLDALATFEEQAFEKDHSDKNWFKGKQRPKQLDTLAERGGKGGLSKSFHPSFHPTCLLISFIDSNYTRSADDV